MDNAIKNGTINTMKTTIDNAGRLVIPKGIREQARLEAGMELRIEWRDGRIEIEPEPLQVKLERRGRLLVAVPAKDVDRLSAATVEETRQELRRNPE